ncbi:MAG: InlB B-repeat-containing protein [Clostridiales bacterium]|nr:InlB B-repeat-containing protein [Clostridiales bacterium]
MNNNWKQKLKKSMKRSLAGFLGLALLATSLPLTDPALAQMNHADLTKDKTTIISKEPVKPAKLKEGQTAEQLIANPKQPAIYTLRTDYKVQRGDKYVVDYQPYIASVGEAATQAEKDKVNQTVKLPDLTGYEKPDDDYLITYDKVKETANGKGKTGNDINGIRFQAKEDFRYKSKANEITIKHVFQDLHDFSKYTNPDGTVGEEGQLITTQNGNTGSTMEVSPLNDNHPNRKGFVPEAPYITMQVPENAENFILEYRYNRAHYDVTFDTKGGTPVPNRTLYYEQTIPTIDDKSIPTKVGSDFLGWMPSITLETTGGTTYPENQIIKDSTGEPILNLAADLKMPASKIAFTAVWKDKPKADYAIQFWAEKSDHADDASIMDKYEYMGTRVYKDADTGFKPNLDAEPVNGLKFPDLNQARLNKIWAKARFNRSKDLYLNKFFVYNKDLTDEQNKDPDNASVVKSVSSTGKTVYNIYYDRQVYDLYFTKSNAQPEENTIYPEIWKYDEKKGEAVMAGGPGNLYHYKARFNEMMYKWPNDAKQTKGFTPGYQSFGWGPNYAVANWPLHLDTPPYRLNADEFLDMANYDSWGGYTKKIDKGDGTSINLKWYDYTTLSFGIKQDSPSIPHHMDFWMDGFKDGETIIRYDLVRTKADTIALGYGHRYPKVTGFTPRDYNPKDPQSGWPVIHEGSEENGRVNEDRINDLNDERDEITPNTSGTYYNNYGIKLPIGQLDFIPAFFSDTDEFGDVKEGGQEFKENGYLQFHYKRNKYPLRFNYDPSIIRDDSYFNSKNQLDTFYEFPLKVLSPDLVDGRLGREKREYFKEDPKNLLDNPNNAYKLGLYDLLQRDKNDPGKFAKEKVKVTNEETGEEEEVYTYKFKRPEGLSDQMVFKGWALDPAGTKLIWENPKETMPTHPVNLYAKWGEPDYKWKVTFDPAGGTLRTIREDKLTTDRKKIQEGDIGQEEVNTYPIKEKEDGNKQVFTVIQRQKLVEPNFKPEKKGYDFMGWEVIRYKKDDKGDYTDEIDDSYRKTYKVPELYSFGNDVVSPIYLKAIWVPNQRVDIDVFHYYLDKDYNLDTSIEQNPEPDKLENKRANYMVATTGDRQDDKYLLAPADELDAHKDTDAYAIYKEYNDRVGLNNSFFQTFRVEPEKIMNTETNQMEENPKAKNNVFKFFYRPFRQREYNVNYIDVQFKGKETEKGAAIIDQEIVKNGNRHYDARNYRQIPGWTLVGDPQQQLFFDVDEETNEFLGINGTGKKEITFYYKDVRVIEVPDPKDPVPEGYVRVTFKAEKGGSFTDNTGKSVTELNYDVIKGLKSDLLPVPQEWAGGKNEDGTEKQKEPGKYYITPEDGKKFTKWDKSPLLNKNTIINDDHSFTAYFDWSGLTAKGMVRTESYTDPKGKWTNAFAPKLDDLKKQLVWKEKNAVKPIPEGTDIQFVYKDDAGNETVLNSDEDLFSLVKEMNVEDKDQTVRVLNIVARVTFKDGDKTKPQELPIPVTVYKNRYEALNEKGDKPKYLSDAEKLPAEKGGLQDVTGDYVRVTVAPTGEMKSKNNKVYYVNPKAWVEIPEVKGDGSSNFINWTADQTDQNEDKQANGKFDFAKRHMFTQDTIITPVGAGDVVEQEKGEEKPNVPDSYVKVIVRTTDKATDETAFEKTFWVDPTKDVSFTLPEPTGKAKQKATLPNLGQRVVSYTFNKQWQKVKAGDSEANLADVQPTKVDLTRARFTDKVTVIEAVYKLSIEAENIVKPFKADKLDIPKGKTIEDKDLIAKITPQEGKEIQSIEVISKPDGKTVGGKQEAKVIVKYKDGTSQGSQDNPVVIPVEVHDNIVPSYDGNKPKDPFMANYVKITFKAGEGGTISDDGKKAYYVSPEVEADMTAIADQITKTAKTGYINGTWDTNDSKKLKDTFKQDTEFTFNFTKTDSIIEGKPGVDTPAGYVTVKFTAGENGEVVGGNKIYYVNPDADVKIVDKANATQGATNEIVVPDTKAKDNYSFKGWAEEIDYTNPIKGDREYVAKFTKNDFTLTYDVGGGTGTVPAQQSAPYGGTVILAKADGLSKENAVFAGWKIGETTYNVGDQVTLTENTTATAQWTTEKHKVSFNLAQGTINGESSKEPVQVEHGKTLGQTLGQVTVPQREGYVFTGWKAGETSFDPATTPVNNDVTLVAQWEKAVEKISENETVDENHFIKVTFKQGKHGQLEGGEVTYKVAKGYDLAQAKANGLTIPGIKPDKYYKALDANSGWDSELKLENQDITFTALYAPEADLIPINPKLTDTKIIQKEKPEGMVLVEFVVDDKKAFMLAPSKFYVATNKEVTITPPAVYNRPGADVFDGWQKITLDDKGLLKATYTEDTSILAKGLGLTEMEIVTPKAGFDFVEVKRESLEQGVIGHLEIIRDGKKYSAEPAREYVNTKKIGKFRVKQVRFGFKIPAEVGKLQSGDLIRHWAENDTMKSNIKEIAIK